MITSEDLRRVEALRAMLFRGIEDCLRRDGHHKSSEGLVTISLVFPHYFDAPSGALSRWDVTVWCYLLVPEGREKTWSDLTLAAALTKAEADVAEWCSYAALEAAYSDTEAADEPPADGDTDADDLQPF